MTKWGEGIVDEESGKERRVSKIWIKEDEWKKGQLRKNERESLDLIELKMISGMRKKESDKEKR